ncbi:MAG TPA: DNA methyltransferase, partial [Candidatus Binatia bacterium]|nr:DNA methyltransferase [Candidatus Binatia bacterium]
GDIYHPDTYKQLRALQKQLIDTPVDTLIKAIILGRLHGHSPSFFSVWTFNVISLSAEQIKAQSAKRGAKPTFRDVRPSILKKAQTILRDTIPTVGESNIIEAPAQKLPLESGTVDLVVTSPPFLGVVNYIDDNWLRFWFLGYDREKLRNILVQTNDLDEYKTFILATMKEMYRVLKSGKRCIIEVGDVNHKSKKLLLDHTIVELAGEAGFVVEKILINHIDAPKISRAFGRPGREVGTKTNRCVILKKI